MFIVAIMLVGTFALSACGNTSKEGQFIGSYTSTFVEGYSTVSFRLEISSDKTFTLKRFENGNEGWTASGHWKGNTSKDDYGIICLILDKEVNQYFTLTMLENDYVVAAAGAAYGSSAFGTGAGYIVVFAKE